VGGEGARPGLMRVAVIGNSGSGKSTLAQQLAAAHLLTALDLDTVAWEPGKIAVPRDADAAAADVGVFCDSHERWVVEGCYAAFVHRALGALADSAVHGSWRGRVSRSLPQPAVGAAQVLIEGPSRTRSSSFLLSWVREYYSRDGDLSLTAHQALFDGYSGPKLRLAHRDRVWLDDLGARFEACQIPAKEWTHAAHLVVGLWHVHRYGAEDALLRLRNGIRRLNESHGGVNSATNGYHETITAAYVELLAQYLASCPADMAVGTRAMQLLASPLAAKDALFTFYSRERLLSTEARAAWVEPDRGPVRAAGVLENEPAAR
jgi:hypothetical protein